MRILSSPGTRALLAAVSCVVLVVVSVVFIDRPVATFTHEMVHGAWPFVDLTHIVDPILPASALGVIVAGIAAMNGWRPGPRGRTLVACCMAALMAYAVKDQLKYASGRLWPETWVNNNPSWIRDGAYGFDPFHGGAGWGSFPSGHMAGITAPMTVLWLRVRSLRWPAVVVTILVVIGLLGADYHFVGDIVAGCGVGVACAIGVMATLHAAWSDGMQRSDEPWPAEDAGPQSHVG